MSPIRKKDLSFSAKRAGYYNKDLRRRTKGIPTNSKSHRFVAPVVERILPDDFVGYTGREQNALRLLGIKSNKEFVELDIYGALFKVKNVGAGTQNKLIKRQLSLKRTLYPLLDIQDFIRYTKREQEALKLLGVKSNKEFLDLDISSAFIRNSISKKLYGALLTRQLSLKQVLRPIVNNYSGDAQINNLNYLFSHDFSQRSKHFKPWAFASENSLVPSANWISQVAVDYPSDSILSKSLQMLFPQASWSKEYLTEKRIADVLSDETKKEWNQISEVQIRIDDFLSCIFTSSLFTLLRDIPNIRLLTALIESLNIEKNIDVHFLDKLNRFSTTLKFMEWCHPNNYSAEILASDVSFDCSLFPQAIVCFLRNDGITSIRDLSDISEQSVLQEDGFTSKFLIKITAIWATLTRLKVINGTLHKYDFPGAYLDTEAMVMSVFMHNLSRPPNNSILKAVCLRYSGGWENRETSLEIIGQKVGLTRERVRQVLLKYLPKLDESISSGKLPRLRNIINNQLWLSGGAMSLDLLARKCSDILGCLSPLGGKILGYMLKGTPEIEVDLNSGIVILLIHPCITCPSLHKRLQQIPSNSAEGRITDFVSFLYASCPDSCPMKSSRIKFHPLWFTKCLLNDAWLKSKSLRILNDNIMSETAFKIYSSSTEDAVLQILRSANKPLHFTEVFQQMKDIYKAANIPLRVSEQRIHMILGGSDECLLWGRGIFMHVNNVNIAHHEILHVIQYLKKEIETKRPFLTVYELFEVYSMKKQADLLPNEQALYGFLRIKIGSQFSLPRFPYIYRKMEKNKLTAADLVEEYVLSASQVVTYTELEEYILKTLHFKYAQMIIEAVPNLVRVDRGYLVHRDNLELHDKRFREIIDFVATLVAKRGHVSAELVYNERAATCRESGITSPYMLHSLVGLVSDDRINTLRYPVLASANDKEIQKNLSIYQTIIDYIIDQDRPVSLEELKQHFIEDRGYAEYQLYNTLSGRAARMGIHRYSKGIYIAEKTLCWSDKKQIVINNFANEEYSLVTKAGNHFARIDNILEREDLPELKECIYWTADLLAGLLESSEKYIILGNKRRTYVPTENVDAISNFSDLVYLLMKKHYGNSVQMDKLSEYLRQNDLVEKCLIPIMFMGSSKLQLCNGMVITKELSQYVA